VEGLLFRHPAVAEVAIVGFPDPRLGERACAFIRLREGESLTLADITHYLSEHRMARQYMPEKLELVSELPRTPSGKIQKFKLRETAAQLHGTSTQQAG
jgi:cyclohexanecarboxylate-CoA ligase